MGVISRKIKALAEELLFSLDMIHEEGEIKEELKELALDIAQLIDMYEPREYRLIDNDSLDE
ncbi:MAG TPA: hypothetical protein EYP59_15510 [Thiotrichaceae bacterium]|nr:hypothetical protein [Thiotrichaceae bacterium]